MTGNCARCCHLGVEVRRSNVLGSGDLVCVDRAACDRNIANAATQDAIDRYNDQRDEELMLREEAGYPEEPPWA